MGRELANKDFFYIDQMLIFYAAFQGRGLRCGGGVSGKAGKGRATRGTERERALEAQFSEGIRDAAFSCRVVES